jgi:hypothetical protein
MTKLIDLKDRIFGRLKVSIRLSDHTTSGGNNHVVWKCICVCGKITSASSGSLLQGKVKSCGCLRIDMGAKKGFANKKHGGYSSLSSYADKVKYQALINIKERSRRRGYESDLELQDLPELTNECPVLGLKYSRGSLKDKNFSPSVDRKNPNLPYLKKYKDNLIFISHRANRIKSDATVEEVKKVLKYMEQQG